MENKTKKQQSTNEITSDHSGCNRILSNFFDQHPKTDANKLAKELLQISFKIILTYHKYSVVIRKRWQEHETQYASIAEKACAHVLDRITEKPSTAWRIWCMLALCKTERKFIHETFNKIYPSTKKSFLTSHTVLVDIMYNNLKSPERIANIVQENNDSVLNDYIVSVKTFSVLITQLPNDIMMSLPKLKLIMHAILKMNKEPPFTGEWRKFANDVGWNEVCNPRVLFRTACHECVVAVERFAPFLAMPNCDIEK